ncbi:DUF6177 family protein [Streptomyces sp. NPDC005132]|uniref:DUF6177 family protein n=1 Tax=Streptomyces sp. NPDC005132 TaxID=3154294 RepID=UPI0033B6B231
MDACADHDDGWGWWRCRPDPEFGQGGEDQLARGSDRTGFEVETAHGALGAKGSADLAFPSPPGPSPSAPRTATPRIAHTPVGVEEHITLAPIHAANETAPVERLPELADALAARHNATLINELRVTRADLTTPAHHEPPPTPIFLTLGPDAVTHLGISHACTAALSPAARPAPH